MADWIGSMDERWVSGSGVRLRCVAWPPREIETSGPPLLLLHGMSSNALFWLRVAEHLSARLAIAVDLRGHGRSEQTAAGYSIEDMTADVENAIQDVDVRHPILVGHSWGAAVALQLAAKNSDLVAGLVLVDGPTAPLTDRMSLEEADRMMRPAAPCYQRLKDLIDDHARFLGTAWGDDLRKFAERSFRHVATGWCPALPEAGRQTMVHALHRFNPRELLPLVDVPTMIVAASDSSDGVAPDVLGWWRSHTEEAASLCSSGQAIRYQSRHDIPLIRPAELASDIEHLLDTRAQRVRGSA